MTSKYGKGYSSVIVIAVVSFIILGLSAIPLLTQKAQTTLPETRITPKTFQDILQGKCEVSDMPTVTSSELGLNIDVQKANIEENTNLPVICVAERKTHYIQIINKQKQLITISDTKSKTIGPAWNLPDQLRGQTIYDKENIKISAYLTLQPGGEYGPGEISVFGQGQKTINALKITTSTELIPQNNPRLIQILKQFSKPPSATDKQVVTDLEAQPQTIKKLFSDFKNIKNPEKQNIEKVLTLLSAFN